MAPLLTRLYTTLCWITLTTASCLNCTGLEQCMCCNTSDGFFSINCSQGQCTFKDVPYIANITELATSLDLSNCDLLNISRVEAPFKNYTRLETLVLHNINLILTDRSTNLFTGLDKLVHLDISGNEQFPMTAETPVEIFENLTSLEVLYMHGTTGTYRYSGSHSNNSYPEELLASLPNLKKLSMDATNITFGEGFLNMTKLVILRISGDLIGQPWRSSDFCKIGNIYGEMLSSLVNIKHLSIIKCAVTNINETAFKNMINLKHIDLSSNQKLSIKFFTKAAQNLNKDIDEIVLDNIEDPYHMSYGVILTDDMAKNLQNLNVKYLSLQLNAINSAEKSVFATLPSTLEHLQISRNEFEIGFYIFEAFHMKNLKKIEMSLNFFTEDYALWRGDKGYMGNSHSSNVATATDETSMIKTTEHLSRRERGNQLVIQDTNYSFHPTDAGHDPDDTDDVIEYDVDPIKLSHNTVLGDDKDRTDKCPSGSFSIPRGTITAYLPPKMESMDVSFSKLGFPIYEFFFDENNSLTEINAANSLLYCWEGPIHGVEKLTRIDLSQNDCHRVSLDFFSKFPELKFLNLSGNLLHRSIERSKNGELFRNNKKLQHLSLALNHIQSVPERFLINQNRLESLILTENVLSEFNLQIEHMTRLVHVNLKNNQINYISEKIRNQFITVSKAEWRAHNDSLTLDLQGNRIECSCNTIEFIRWVSEHYNEGSGRLRIYISECKRGPTSEVYTNITSENDLMVVMEQLTKECASYTTIYVGIAVALVFLLNVIVGVTVHRFRWKIRYWYYVSRTKKHSQARNGYAPIESEDTRFKYDVYVVSINEDTKFVVETLKKRLENESYRVFLQDFDVPPGQNMYSFIANGIHVSRVALFVVSNGCDSDPDWHIAIRMVQEESTQRAHRMYLGLVLDLNKIKCWSEDMKMLSRTVGLDFPENRGNQAVTAFWVDFLEELKEVHIRQADTFSINSVD